MAICLPRVICWSDLAGPTPAMVEPGMTRWEDPDQQLATYDQALEEGLTSVPAAERARYDVVVARFKALNRREG